MAQPAGAGGPPDRGPPTTTSTTSTATTSSTTSTTATSLQAPPAGTNALTSALNGSTTTASTSSSAPVSGSYSSQLITAPTSTSSTTNSSAVPLEQANAGSASNGMSSGVMVAAILVPLLLLGLIAAAVLLYRRRRRNGAALPQMRQRSTPSDAADGTAMPFVAPYSSLDDGSEREHSGEYYAPGRSDTSSYTEPPPPYKAKTHDPSGGPIQASAIGPIPQVRLPTGLPYNPPSPDSWATAPHHAAFLDSSSAFTRSTSRAGTEQSINSDLYSDNASLRSAHAARMSVGATNVMSQANASRPDFNPFQDPQSPVSSVDGDETRSFTGLPDRAISPVSFRSRT